MIDVTFLLGSTDYSAYLSTYTVTHEVEARDSMTAWDGTEYVYSSRRPIITFSLIPMTDAQISALYTLLSAMELSVKYTDPYIGSDQTATFRVAMSLESVFGVSPSSGTRYYKGGQIILRRKSVIP